MFKAYHANRDTNEGGFSLVELLVVILIIGVLTAIAIPMFLNQRKVAMDATAKSDMKNAITSVQQYYNKYPNATKIDLVEMRKLMNKDENSRITFTGPPTDYCIEVRNAYSDVHTVNYTWTSTKGGNPIAGNQNGFSCSDYGASTWDTHVVWF